jgi:calcium-dependent protein kinase
VIVVPL